MAAGYPNYAPWVPLLFHGFTFVALVLSITQRIDEGHAQEAAGLVALTILAYATSEILGPRMPWFVFALASLAPLGALRWAYPVEFDFTLLAVALIVGRFGALEPVGRSAVVFSVTLAGMLGLGLFTDFHGTGFAVAVVIAGWDLGWIMQTQQRRIDRQQEEQVQREAQAALEERQRIAREVHDVIAHSLSVTLLHLTAARRDLEDGGDVDEAIDALRDAETVGRQAMHDIRQTVGLLNSDRGSLQAAPDLSDVPALVQQFRSAGLDVELEVAGDGATLSAAVRTGLFRIVQESLANIAKHEPLAAARVTLDLAGDPARVTIVNSLTHPVGAVGGGSGLHGMQERATSLGANLTAGPDARGWRVQVEFANPHAHSCPLPKLRDLRGASSPETA